MLNNQRKMGFCISVQDKIFKYNVLLELLAKSVVIFLSLFLAQKIHISETTKTALVELGSYCTEFHAEMNIKVIKILILRKVKTCSRLPLKLNAWKHGNTSRKTLVNGKFVCLFFLFVCFCFLFCTQATCTTLMIGTLLSWL